MRDSALPWATGKLFGGSANTLYALAAQLKVLAYFNLGVNSANWRTWLATNGPILTRLNVDATWDAASDNKGALAEYKPRTARGGHAVAIVGYRPGEFIVRNSWGTGWGDKGPRTPRLARRERVHGPTASAFRRVVGTVLVAGVRRSFRGTQGAFVSK